MLSFVWGITMLFGQVPGVRKTNGQPAFPNVPIAHDTIMPELRISFALTINGKPMGEIDAGVWHNEAILEKELAARLLIDYLRPDIYSTIFDTIFKGLTWLSAEDFAITGIAFEFDSAELTISITIPPEYAPVVDIDFVPEQVPNYKPILRPAPFSGFIQNESNLQVSSSSDSTLFFSTKLYSMIDIMGTHLFGSGYVSLSQTSSSYYFDSMYALWNDNARKLQISLGMISAPGTGFQSQPSLYAISFASVENQRYIVRQGFIDDKTEFTVHKLAKVTVEVNGRPIRQVLLAPGNYRILDLPFTTGLNEFILRIEETDGNVQVLRRIVPRDGNILQVGTSEFAFSAGASTTDWSEFFASGYYLYGFSPTFSGGINLQSDKRSAMGGLTWVSALPIGTLNGSASVVGRWDGWGEMFAPAASVSYLFSMPEKDYIPSLGISANYRGLGFESPGTSAPTGSAPDAFFSLSANLYSKIFARTGTSIGYSFTLTESAPPTMTHGLYASISQSFIRGGNVNLSGQLSFPASGTPTFFRDLASVLCQRTYIQRSFNYLPGLRREVRALAYWTKSPPLDNSSMSTSMRAISCQVRRMTAPVGLGIRNNSDYIDVSASGALSYENSTNTYSGSGYAQLRTTMAFIGNHVAFTRQIPDSFLLITSSPAMKNGAVSYKLSSGSQYLAKHGQNVVVPLTSYTTAVLSTDLVEASLNLNPRHPFVVVSPRTAAAFSLRAMCVETVYHHWPSH